MTSRVMTISPLAGKRAAPSMPVNVSSLITAYYVGSPDPSVPAQRVSFGSGGPTAGVADGIVITPSHNPPHDGGVKYNAAQGGPAEPGITNWIEAKAGR